jgi:hypothetical protein
MKLKEAIDYFGNQAKLAKALGINPSAVTQWGESIPRRRQYEIERLSGGRLRADAELSQGAPATEAPPDAPDDEDGLAGLRQEIARLSGLVAQLSLLIEDAERIGNRQAEVSLRVQYHQAFADLLGNLLALAGVSDPRLETLRQRHIERSVESQRELDQMG